MKDLLLIDNGLSKLFWAKAMNTPNYLQNWLPTKYIANKAVLILEKAQILICQNLKHVKIFDSRLSIHIPFKKRFKSDIHKTWKNIFIEYTDVIKYLKAWTPKSC